jgi:restriction system protein
MSAAQVAEVVKVVRSQDHEDRKKRLRKQISDVIENEGESIPRDWTETLLDELGRITSDAFERLCQRLLRESGFTKVEVTGRAGDGGIDGYGILRVKLVSFQVLFQSKRWKGSVGSNTIRDFRGAMIGRADKGLVITTGTFTKDARTEATRDGAPAIDLVDGDDLCQLLKELQIGVQVQLVEEVTLDLQALSTI